MQVYIKDQLEKFPKDEQTIDWIGSLMDSHESAQHIQWIKGTLTNAHLKSMTGFVNVLKLWFKDEEKEEKAYEDIENVQ